MYAQAIRGATASFSFPPLCQYAEAAQPTWIHQQQLRVRRCFIQGSGHFQQVAGQGQGWIRAVRYRPPAHTYGVSRAWVDLTVKCENLGFS